MCKRRKCKMVSDMAKEKEEEEERGRPFSSSRNLLSK